MVDKISVDTGGVVALIFPLETRRTKKVKKKKKRKLESPCHLRLNNSPFDLHWHPTMTIAVVVRAGGSGLGC